MPYQPIENYGVVGDQHTVALIGMNGSIDFMCFPFFDSPTIFGALLDDQNGGRFELHPVNQECKHRQMYLPDSNILLTRFLFEDGVAEITDFMPIGQKKHAHDLVRQVKSIKGEISFRFRCAPRFDYGRQEHRVERVDDGSVLFLPSGQKEGAIRFRCTKPFEVESGIVKGEFGLRVGEEVDFVLEEVNAGEASPSGRPEYVTRSFVETLNYWRRWTGKSRYKGRWREMVNRSALILKLLIFQPTGAIVAAPTFGLPEVIGGERNWDYRLTWIRDASFTIYALIRLGYTEEAGKFMDWIEARCDELEPDGSLQVMYGIDGRHELPEEVLNNWEGYRGSGPVRTGNGAYNQLQLDIYGELMDSVYLYDKYGKPVSHDLWNNIVDLLGWVCKNWRQPDEGIWEVRGGRYDFLYSRMMCWVALDRGTRLAIKRSRPAPVAAWLECRDGIYRDIFRHFWDEKSQAFVQSADGHTLDASALLMPLVRFISPRDPRWLSTLKAIDENLVYDSLVYRYRAGDGSFDGLVGEEGTFNMCTFWFAECLSRAGDLDRGRFVFEKMLGYANHLGLYSEELGYQAEHLGNFPQAFTHLSLISAAYDLDRRLNFDDEGVDELII